PLANLDHFAGSDGNPPRLKDERLPRISVADAERFVADALPLTRPHAVQPDADQRARVRLDSCFQTGAYPVQHAAEAVGGHRVRRTDKLDDAGLREAGRLVRDAQLRPSARAQVFPDERRGRYVAVERVGLARG